MSNQLNNSASNFGCKSTLLLIVALIAHYSTYCVGDPLVNQDIEREQAERLEQIEQSKKALDSLVPILPIPAPPIQTSAQCFDIKQVSFVGNSQMEASTLLAITGFVPACLGINEINEYLRLITNAYVEAGYVTSRAFLVPQDLSSGVLTIEILEGRLEKVLFNGEPKGFLNNAFPKRNNPILNLRDIEQGLDQINRLSRYNAQIKLLPGRAKGMSIVDIQTNTGSFGYVGIGINNGGQESTGEEQAGINGGIENVFDALDKWTVSLNKSSQFVSDKDSESAYLALDVPRGYWNVGIRTSYSNYFTTFTNNNFSFNSSGRTNSFDVDVNWLFHRDSVSKSSAKWGVHHRREKNYILGNLLSAGSRNVSSASLSLSHSTRLGGGFFTVSPRLVLGTDWFGGEEDSGKSSAASEAQFYKGTLTTSYSYPIMPDLNASSTLFGQWSNDTLYGSERLSIGGEYSVRGFKGRSISGDEGYYWRNDLTYQLGQWPVIGRVSSQLALDTGSIKKDSLDALEKGALMGSSVSLMARGTHYASSFSVGFPIQSPSRLHADDVVIYYRLDLNL